MTRNRFMLNATRKRLSPASVASQPWTEHCCQKPYTDQGPILASEVGEEELLVK